MRQDQQNETCSDKPTLGYLDIKPIVPTIARSGLFLGPVGSVVEVLEVPSLTSTCNPPRIPESNLAPVLMKQDLGITVCGGSFTANCWVLTPQGWIASQAMGEARAHAASVQLGDSWWVSGGRRCGSSNCHVATSELLSPDGSWRNYVNLPTVLSRHCLVRLNATHIFMMGGLVNSFHSGARSTAYIFDSVSTQWTPVASMRTARYDHGCALLPDGRVVVTGGNGVDGGYLSSTEFFSLSSLAWTDGPDLPLGIARFGMDTIETETYTLGGSVGGFGRDTDVIYRLSQDRSAWIEAGRMNSERDFVGVLPINFEDCFGFSV